MIDQFKQWFADHRDTIYDDFFAFLKFASISTDPTHKKDMLACAGWLQKYLETFGFQTELWETSGHPTLYGENLSAGPDCPTLLFYLHYDVQPVTPLEEWNSPPFEPTVKEGKVVARGAVDNKGQCFYTLTALKAFHALSKKLGINVKLCIEGEEEIGSEGLSGILDAKKEKLKADYFLVIDFDMLGEKQPAITLGMRGITTINISCRNSTVDLHSGSFGGFVVNPARALMRAVSVMWDDEGKVTIPGFYDKVKSFQKEELEEFAWDVDPKELAAPFKVGAFAGENGYSLLESNWIRPVLEINGMSSGYTGSGFKTIIPAKSMVKLSCRLVPDQDPKEILSLIADFLKKKLPAGIDVELELGHGSRGMITSPHSKLAEMTAQAFEEVFQTSCKKVLCGATIPIVPELAKVSGAELVMTGVGLAEDGMHAPNESFGLERFEKGFLSIARIVEILSGE